MAGEKQGCVFFFQVIHPDAISGGAFAQGRSQQQNVKAVIQDVLGLQQVLFIAVDDGSGAGDARPHRPRDQGEHLGGVLSVARLETAPNSQ